MSMTRDEAREEGMKLRHMAAEVFDSKYDVVACDCASQWCMGWKLVSKEVAGIEVPMVKPWPAVDSGTRTMWAVWSAQQGMWMSHRTGEWTRRIADARLFDRKVWPAASILGGEWRSVEVRITVSSEQPQTTGD